MTKPQIIVLMGFLFLVGLVLWQFKRINEMEEATAALRQQTGAEASVVRAAAVISSDGSPAADGVDPGSQTAGPPPKRGGSEREARFGERREMDRKQRQDAKLLALTTKLNLSPEQQDTIRAALEKGSAARDAVREAGEVRRRSGIQDSEETRRADMAKYVAAEAAQEETIASGLSADQLAAYTEYQTEQKQNSIENRANQQLGDLLTRFSLSEDQKDAAFQFFAKQEEENSFEPDRIAAIGGDFMTLFNQRQKNELEALKQILTPAQYELYRTQQEQRGATFRNLIPGAPPGRP